DLEIIKQQILDAGKRNLRPINTLETWREGRAIAIVGGGPSLTSQLEKLKEYDTIMVCGSAHDYLVSTGIIPTYCIVCDPDAIMASYLTKPHKDVTYLLGTQCHAAVFDALKNNKCYTWDSVGTAFSEEFNDSKAGVNGGCTVGTRAIVCAMCFGY